MSVKFVLSIVSLSLVFASELHDEKFAKQKEDCTGIVYGIFTIPKHTLMITSIYPITKHGGYYRDREVYRTRNIFYKVTFEEEQVLRNNQLLNCMKFDVSVTPSVVVPCQCSKGVIEWMNSTGQMDVTFDPDMYEDFTVCIAWWKGAVCTRLLDQTLGREGQDIAPENPLEGTPVCLQSVIGKVKVSCTYSGDPTVLEYLYHIDSTE